MDAPEKSRFDLSLMGNADKHNLCVTFLEAIERYFDDPANRERFERWQQGKNETRNAKAVKI